MARLSRKKAFDPDTIGIYHCWNRCVRRAFLMGRDDVSGRSFDHRREWVQSRLRFLSGVFALDHLNFAIMGNHLHVLLRNRPDIRDQWMDEEVVRRWCMLFPVRDKNGKPTELTPEAIAKLVQNKAWVAERRRRLGDISWFMRCLAENIAHRANVEEEISSRFWQGRFRLVRILDEAGLLACAIYIDLNPIRACLADTPETSLYTSIYVRLIAVKQQSEKIGVQSNSEDQTADTSQLEPLDSWLSPVELVESTAQENDPSPQTAPRRGYLPLSVPEYVNLLDWTGRQLRSDKRGSIPVELAPIFERLRINGEMWVDAVSNFSRWFRTAVGRAEKLAEEANRSGRRFFQCTARCQAVFGS